MTLFEALIHNIILLTARNSELDAQISLLKKGTRKAS